MPLETEAQRQFYLSMAGIQLWYARKPQPGAAPSPDFDFGECNTAETSALPEVIKPPAPKEKFLSDNGLALVKGLMNGVNSRPQNNADSIPVAIESEVKSSAAICEPPGEIKSATLNTESQDEDLPTVVSTTESLKSYSLAATWSVWITESYVLISTLSSDSSTQLQESLANNILRAMGESVNATQTFMWPVFRNPVVQGNDAEGFRQLLADFARECQGRSFLCLGLLSDVPRAPRAVWLQDALGPLKVDFPHGLAGIATYPERKRDLWSELQPLVSGKR